MYGEPDRDILPHFFIRQLEDTALEVMRFQQDLPYCKWNLDSLVRVFSWWSHLPFWLLELAASMFRFSTYGSILFLWGYLKSQVCSESTTTQKIKGRNWKLYLRNTTKFMQNRYFKFRQKGTGVSAKPWHPFTRLVLFDTYFQNIYIINQ